MKRLLTMLLMAVMFVSAYAQDEAEHMTFMGVPIDGPVDEFVNKMKQKGFTYLKKDDGSAFMQGDFAGYKDCTIAIIPMQSNDDVYVVRVMLPDMDDWATLESNYDTLKSMLTKKYGEPVECVEKFEFPVPSTLNNTMKLRLLRNNECTWQTDFRIPAGSVVIGLTSYDYTSTYIQLGYYDEINTRSAVSDAMDDL